ncbi:PH domain-containing protein [Priestia megaterium]|nr:PH domain-containing protein [Priestia megaterium]
MVFKIKRSPILVAISLLLIVLPLFLYLKEEARNIDLIVPVLLSLFILYTLIHAHFIIKDDHLIIVFGILNKKIPIQHIQRIHYTKNPISAPAWTLKRLQIDTYDRSILISLPKDESGFFNALTAINKNINLPN